MALLAIAFLFVKVDKVVQDIYLWIRTCATLHSPLDEIEELSKASQWLNRIVVGSREFTRHVVDNCRMLIVAS